VVRELLPALPIEDSHLPGHYHLGQVTPGRAGPATVYRYGSRFVNTWQVRSRLVLMASAGLDRG